MIKYSMNKNLESSITDNKPSSLDVSLNEAVFDFRKEYILAIAKQTAKFNIYSISRALNYDRSELSKLINETSVKPEIDKLQKEYNPGDWFSKKVTSEISSPLTQEVIIESISENNFDIKKATVRFKKKYITQKVNQHGVKKTAEILCVNERTIRNHFLENYNINNISITNISTLIN